MMKKLGIFLFLLFTLTYKVDAQELEILIEDAEFFLEEKDFENAYLCYAKVAKKDPKNIYWRFQQGLCALHIPNRKTETIDLFLQVRKEEPEEKQVLYYLGRAYHANYKFEEAVKYFSEYLDSGDKTQEVEAQHYRTNSKFGINLVKTMVEADITSLGQPINTEGHEYVPVISADEATMIYTYRGEKSTGGLMDRKFKATPEGTYYEDIFISKKDSLGKFQEGKSISEYINTKHHDAAIALSPDGQILFTFLSEIKDKGDIYICHLMGDTWSKPERIKGDVNTNYWEGSCSTTADGNYLYFASERPGGFGGRDLYASKMDKNGIYGKAENLGPSINTKYDEDDPFIHPDGITLFFSSEGHKSIGGYDIMYSVKQDGKWIDPMNMGYPLNTTDDDRFYVITAKGDRGYFSSNRASIGGNGSQDIFTVTPGILGEKPVLAMLVGTVFGNDVPVEGELIITKKSTGEIIGPFHSNSKSGKYLVALTPGENYNVKVKVPTFPEHSEDFDIATVHKFVEIKKDFHLAKDGYIDPHVDTLKSLNEIINPTVKDTSVKNGVVVKDSTPVVVNNPPEVKDTTPVIVAATNPCDDFKNLDFSALKSKSLNDPVVYQKLMDVGAKICASGMVFKVQIGAYRFPQNFKYKHLKQYGEAEVTPYPDGITRFTQQQFTSIKEAEKLRKKIIASGQKDAWITGFLDGKRYTLEELILVDFFNKNIAQFNENLQVLLEYVVKK